MAAADFNEGDTWADGYTAKPTGEETALPDKAFVAGDLVSLVADTAGKKLGFKMGGGGWPPGWRDNVTGQAWEDGNKGDPIVFGHYSDLADGASVIPSFYTPASTVVKTSYSYDGRYLACLMSTGSTWTGLFFERDENNEGYKLRHSIDGFVAADAVWSFSNTSYKFLCSRASGYPTLGLFIYEIVNSVLVLSQELTPPSGTHLVVNGAEFSIDDSFVASMGTFSDASLRFLIFNRKVDGSYNFGQSQPSVFGYGWRVPAIRPDMLQIVAQRGDSPGMVTVFSRTEISNQFVATSTFTLPGGTNTQVYNLQYNSTGDLLLFSIVPSPYCSMYYVVGDTFTLCPNPDVLPKGGSSVVFMKNGEQVLTSTYPPQSDGIPVYPYQVDRTGTLPQLKKLPNISGFPTVTDYAKGLSASADHVAFGCLNGTSPRIVVLRTTEKDYLAKVKKFSVSPFMWLPNQKLGVLLQNMVKGQQNIKANCFPALNDLI